MSEERRKRQQVREKQAQPKPVGKIIVVVLIASAFAAAAGLGIYKRNHRYDNFARCLAEKKAVMYGLYWCEHCAEQKELFGASFQYVPYVECGIKGQRGEEPVCSEKGIKLFPTWQFAEGPQPQPGKLSLETLSDRTGCSLP